MFLAEAKIKLDLIESIQSLEPDSRAECDLADYIRKRLDPDQDICTSVFRRGCSYLQ